jgi:hypothetical protein
MRFSKGVNRRSFMAHASLLGAAAYFGWTRTRGGRTAS